MLRCYISCNISYRSNGLTGGVMAAGKKKPMQMVAVAPVNWKASQMLGMRFAATTMRVTSPILEVMQASNCLKQGLAAGNRRPI